MFQWWLTAVAVVGALAALARGRSLARRLDRMSESYWELRYEVSQLRARVNRIDPQQPTVDEPGPAPGATAFVPLSSLKK